MGLFNLFNKPEKEDSVSLIQVGQEWHYQTRQLEESSTLKIVKIEQYEIIGKIIHISILDLKVKHPKFPNELLTEATHIPITEAALLKSITSIKNDRCDLPDYEFGYVRWKSAFDEDKAGYFAIPVNEVVHYLEESANK